MIFDIAEREYKKWSKRTSADAAVCESVHCAILTMSEAHCKEAGYNKLSGSLSNSKRITPAMTASDILTIGIHLNARIAAECAVKAIGEAAADSFSGQPDQDNRDYYDEDCEKESASNKAMDSARKAQADWLRENITLTFG
jgi:hypothetical protein